MEMDGTEVMRSTRTNLTPAQKEIMRNKRYAPATGVPADFEKLLMSFVEKKSVRYEDFAELWREKKFSLICAGRQSMREVKEFMEECMAIAVKMFLPPYGFQARVGALYLLYGLYYTQPCHPRVPIRVTREAWQEIMTLQQDFVKQNHHDTNYIFFKLLLDRAFHFCFAAEEKKGRLGVDSGEQKYEVSRSSALTEDKQSIDELFPEEVFEQLSLIHTQYHQLKVKLAGPDSTRPDRSLDVLQDKFPNSVVEHLVKHHERCKKKDFGQPPRRRRRSDDDDMNLESGDEEGSDPEYQPHKNSVGQRRAALKRQAFTGAKQAHRRRHRNLVVESAVADADEPSQKKARVGRPRKKTSDSQDDLPITFAKDNAPQMDAEGEASLMNMPHLEETEAPPRKRGRPRKSVSQSASINPQPAKPSQHSTDQGDENDNEEEEDDDGHTEMETLPVAVAPKRRGRPPKKGNAAEKRATPKQTSVSDDGKDEGTPSKKQRVESTAKKQRQEEATPTKRKRGRPPKAKPSQQKSAGKETGESSRGSESKTDRSQSALRKSTERQMSKSSNASDGDKDLEGNAGGEKVAEETAGSPPEETVVSPPAKRQDKGEESKNEKPTSKRVGRPPSAKKGKGPVVRPLLVKFGKKD